MFLIIAGGQVCARHVCDKGDTENSLGIKQQLSPSSACHKWGNPQSSREGQSPIDGVNSYLTKALRQFKMCITHAWTGIMSYLLKMKYWSNAFKFCLCMLLHACDWLVQCVMVVAEAGPCGDGGSNSGQGIPGGPDCLSDAVSPRPRRPQQRQVLADIHQRPATAL